MSSRGPARTSPRGRGPRRASPPDEELHALYRICEARGFKPAARANVMREVHARALIPHPGLAISSAVLVAYAAVVALGLVAMAPGIRVLTASDDFDRQERVEGLTFAYPSSFNATRQESSFALERGSEGVVLLVSAVEPGRTAERALAESSVPLMLGAPVAKGETASSARGPCAGGDAPTTRWRAEVSGIIVDVEACAVLRDGRAYVLAAIEPEGLEPGQRVAARIVAGAHF